MDFAGQPDTASDSHPFSPHELITRLIDDRAIFNHDTNPSLAGNPSGIGSRRIAIVLCTTQSPGTDPGTTRFKHTSTFSAPNNLRTRSRHLSRSPRQNPRSRHDFRIRIFGAFSTRAAATSIISPFTNTNGAMRSSFRILDLALGPIVKRKRNAISQFWLGGKAPCVFLPEVVGCFVVNLEAGA